MTITICDNCKRDLTQEEKYYKFTVNYHILRNDSNKKNNDFVTKSRDSCRECFGKFMTNAKIPFEEQNMDKALKNKDVFITEIAHDILCAMSESGSKVWEKLDQDFRDRFGLPQFDEDLEGEAVQDMVRWLNETAPNAQPKYKNINRLKGQVEYITALDQWKVTFPDHNNNAFTLEPSNIGVNESGWTIEGEIQRDYFEWVNEFEAHKGDMWVKGDFEDVVNCSSLEALEDFLTYHEPDKWDYGDI